MTPQDTHDNHAFPATLAALCIFNGLHLSPVQVSPDPGLLLVGPVVAPKFSQLQNYMSRFFDENSAAEDFNPLEVFNGAVSAAQWIRGGCGILQYALYNEAGIDIPDAATVDPAAWFDRLDDMATLWRNAGFCLPPEMVLKLTETWQERDAAPRQGDSRAAFLARLYGQARELQRMDAFLTVVTTIARARANRPLAAGQSLPFPEK